MGEVFVGLGGADFLKGAASRPICLRCCLQDFCVSKVLLFFNKSQGEFAQKNMV